MQVIGIELSNTSWFQRGDNDSVKNIQQLYRDGHATKEDYTKALLACQAYLEEVRSEQRDEATAAYDGYKCY